MRAPGATEEDRVALTRRWERFQQHTASFKALEAVGKYAEVDLEFSDGQFAPKPRGWTTGPDDFELQIGNTLAYSVPLVEHEGYLQHLKAQWLPYYGESLRRERLRRLYFQSFDRLYNMFQEFLQAVFIARRTYPIAYDKWVREQVEEVLGLPELYQKLPKLLEIQRFESREIGDKAKELAALLEEYAVR